MQAIARLKRDHRILRSKLDVLEAALRMGPETWYVLREVCYTLSRQLQNHIKREDELVLAYYNAIAPEILTDISVEHHDEPEHLETINRMFVGERERNFDRIGTSLAEVINGLRRHMAEEEAALFPILERELEAQESATLVYVPKGHLHECMTVNRVVHEYPTTRAVFEKFFVNISLEGSSCLDEVAWQHGLDLHDLLEQLELDIPHPLKLADSHYSRN